MNQEKIFFITDSACDIPAKDEQELENLCILPMSQSSPSIRVLLQCISRH